MLIWIAALIREIWQLLFLSKTSIEQQPLENRYFYSAVTFRNSYLLGGGIVQNRDIYRRATFSKQILLHSINFFWRTIFWKKQVFHKSNIPHYLFFLDICFFRVATFSRDATFYNSYLFRRATFLQHFFPELLFLSCTSFPQRHFLFIS